MKTTADRNTNDGRIGTTPQIQRRIDLLDIARAMALMAMASYHFTWDLEFFGYVERGLTGAGAWKIYARCIASTFLFLAGIGLVLGHGRGIRWRAFWRRWTGVAAGALAITVVTFFATPDGWVFFGILHEIALASLLGLAFLSLPAAITAIAGIGIIALPFVLQTAATNPKLLAWIGFAATPPPSNDFVPLFPWFGVVLLGIAAARLAARLGLFEAMERMNARLARLAPLAFLGRHSLLFYLIHQPLLFGLVWSISQVAPPDPARILGAECRRSCIALRDTASCAAYCGCVVADLRERSLLKQLVDGTATADDTAIVQTIVQQCSMRTPPVPLPPPTPAAD